MTNRPRHLSRRSLSAAERVERNRQIAEARAAGVTWAAIEQRFGLSVSQAQRAVKEHAAAGIPAVRRLADVDADALLARAIEAHDRALSCAVGLLVSADSDSARVGAIRSVATVGSSLHLMLLRSGLVGDPGLIRFHAEIETAVRTMFALAEKYGIPREVVVAEVEGLPRRGRPAELVEVAA